MLCSMTQNMIVRDSERGKENEGGSIQCSRQEEKEINDVRLAAGKKRRSLLKEWRDRETQPDTGCLFTLVGFESEFMARYSAPALKKGLNIASGSLKSLWTTLTRKQVFISSDITFREGDSGS